MDDKLLKSISKLEIGELLQLQTDVSNLVREKQITAKQQVMDEFKSIAERSGLSFAQVVWSDEKTLGVTKTGRRRKQYKPKYRNPANLEQTWTGLGKQPNWLRALMNEGHNREEYRIAGE